MISLITGATRGIGRATAEHLAAQGSAVGLIGRTAKALHPVAEACRALGVPVAVAVADVNDPDSVRAAAASVTSALGPVDLVVNSAGLIDQAEVPFWEADIDAWWSVVETNLRGVANVCRAVLPAMVERGSGRIVNLASGMGTEPYPDYSAYSTSKGAVLLLTANMADQLAEKNVYVFDISPGAVLSDMTADRPMFEGKTDWYDVKLFLGAVSRAATGDLDALTGRFIHAGKDNLDALVAQAAELQASNKRRLTLS